MNPNELRITGRLRWAPWWTVRCGSSGSTDPDGAVVVERFPRFGGGVGVMLTVVDDAFPCTAAAVVLNRREVKTIRRWLKENMPDA